jgi:hypothetical protein
MFAISITITITISLTDEFCFAWSYSSTAGNKPEVSSSFFLFHKFPLRWLVRSFPCERPIIASL